MNTECINNPTDLAAHLFRHEAGKMTATLTKLFGFGNVQIAEDIVQETMISALQHWTKSGIPPNPTAWLYRVAKNKALDFVRRRQHFTAISIEIASMKVEELSDVESAQNQALERMFEEKSIDDNLLQMLFACSHPALTEEAQITLALKTLCGLSVQEVANAFLCGKDTIEKRLYRAKERIRESGIAIEFPAPKDLNNRLEAVLQMLYLLFNEGYNSSHPDELIRRDLCEEALRLCRLLLEYPPASTPQVNALMALLLFQASRFEARMKESGEMVMLSKQDPALWNGALIAEGAQYLAASAKGESASKFHLEAGIAAHYAFAPSFEAIDWREIDKLYGVLMTLAPSPMALLNRAIVRSYLHGAEAALTELAALEKPLGKYYLYHATLGELHKRCGNAPAAQAAWQTAQRFTESTAEQQFLAARIKSLQD